LVENTAEARRSILVEILSHPGHPKSMNKGNWTSFALRAATAFSRLNQPSAQWLAYLLLIKWELTGKAILGDSRANSWLGSKPAESLLPSPQTS